MKAISNPHQFNLFRSSRHVSTGEAAAMLKVSVGTVCAYCDQGILESFQRKKPNGHRRVMYDSIVELLARWADEAFSGRERQPSKVPERAL